MQQGGCKDHDFNERSVEPYPGLLKFINLSCDKYQIVCLSQLRSTINLIKLRKLQQLGITYLFIYKVINKLSITQKLFILKFIMWLSEVTKNKSIFILLSLIVVLCSSAQLQLTNKQIASFYGKLLGKSLEGQWIAVTYFSDLYDPQSKFFGIPQNSPIYKQDTKVVNFFNNTIGQVQMFFWSKNSNQIPDQLYIQLYDRKFINKKVIEFNIDLTQHASFSYYTDHKQKRLMLWSGKKIITTVSLFEHFESLVRFDITMDLDIYFKDENSMLSNQTKNIEQDKPIIVTLHSESINFTAFAYSSSYPNISYILGFLTLIQVVFIILKKTLSHESAAQRRKIMYKISQWIILHTFCFLCFFSFLYIKIGLNKFDTELHSLLYLGLLNIGIGLFLLRNYEMVMQKFKNRIMMLKAVTFVAAYLILTNKFYDDISFWIFQMSILLAEQIVYSIIQGGKGGLPADLVGFLIASRIPLLYLLVSQNVAFRIQPISLKQISFLAFLFGIYFLVIHLQSKHGGRFLVPNQIIPDYYDYYHAESSQNEKMKQDCPICLVAINKEPNSQNIQLQNTVSNIADQNNQTNLAIQVINGPEGRVRFMKTPCGHIFHIKCLTQYMQTKLVCPICRSTLPQLAELN